MAIIPLLRTNTMMLFSRGKINTNTHYPRFNHTISSIAHLCREGRVKDALHILLTSRTSPLHSSTYLQLLQTCITKNAISEGKLIHSFIIHIGFPFARGSFFQNKLINLYAKCGGLVHARKVLDHMTERDIFSWNLMIAAYRRNGLPQEALTLFHQMQQTGVQPDEFTFASILPACAQTVALEHGMDIHQRIIKSGFSLDVVVANALVDLYVKCGSIQKARELFDKMPQRDVVSWTAMIAGFAQNGFLDEAFRLFKEMPQPDAISWTTIITGYAQNGAIDEALRLFKEMPLRDRISWTAMIAGYVQNGLFEKSFETFKQMQLAGVNPDSATFASILPACAKMGALDHGMEFHKRIIEGGFFSDAVVVNALIDMYVKCGSLQKAREVFGQMCHPNLITWTAIIAGYAQNGFVEMALETFKQMQLAGIKPDSTTFSGILPACAKMGALEQGMEFHKRIMESGFLSDVIVANALIDMYAKCGCIQKARNLFDNMHHPNSVSWTVMIAGYAMHGYGKDALKLFELMKHCGPNPNRVSLLCVLFACNHAGLVNEGCKYFNLMSESYSIIPAMDHCACVADLLGRAGYLEDALIFIIKMPIKPDLDVWMSFFGACRSHKNIELGEFAATLLFELDPKNAASYVLLSNMYAQVSRWGDVQKVWKLMKDRGIKKTPGCSWTEVHKMVHVF